MPSAGITDDGVGFQPPERLGAYVSESKLGIIGMEQRVLSVGGTVEFDSDPGEGTSIRASIPYVRLAQVVQAEDA